MIQTTMRSRFGHLHIRLTARRVPLALALSAAANEPLDDIRYGIFRM